VPAVLARQVEAVRRFNRAYTRQIGVLHEHLLASPFSLTEARVLYEIAHRDDVTARVLAGDLGLDAGYLSRMLAGFSRRGLVTRRRSGDDGREYLLRLTSRGRATFGGLDAAARDEVGAMLSRLRPADRETLVGSMDTIQRLLGPAADAAPRWILRDPRPGDMGWVVQRHGALYAQEYGWDREFEALVAGIVARFVRRFDPRRERCWVAEKDGENVGCIFCVQRTKTVAQLRMLLVEPSARGLGIGKRLVAECVAFARACGYEKMTLWTNDILHAARALYVAEGFRLVDEDRHHSFGHDLVGQTWDLKL
jgi:DNA-binding MarR family transcriptional regulator/N-acetylglutamate synthase-like GNAT family acetyltransferase